MGGDISIPFLPPNSFPFYSLLTGDWARMRRKAHLFRATGTRAELAGFVFAVRVSVRACAGHGIILQMYPHSTLLYVLRSNMKNGKLRHE